MSFFQKAAEAAEKAAAQAAAQAKSAADRVAEKASDPGTQAQARVKMAQAGMEARRVGRFARRGLTTVIERIDPGLLADVVIKATALQEKANASLRDKQSPYRISEVVISAAIPPQVSFTIARIDDVEETMAGQGRASSDLVDAGLESPVLTLDGRAGELEALEAVEEEVADDDTTSGDRAGG